MIGIVIDVPYPERVQRGWHDAIPIRLYVQSEVLREGQSKYIDGDITANCPFHDLNLADSLDRAKKTIADWTEEWIWQNGTKAL